MSQQKLSSLVSQTLRLIASALLLVGTLTLVASAPAQAAVTGLKVTSVSATDATIAWSRYSGAERYRIYWSTSASMPGACEPNCTVIKPGSASSPSIALSSVTSLTPGRTYYVKVSPVSSSGRTLSGWQSTPLTVTLSNDGDVIPSAVQNIQSTNITSANATLSWDTVPTAVRYRIYVRTTNSFPGRCEPNCWVRTPTVTGNRASIDLSSVLTPRAGTTYYVKISAINGAGKTITGWQPQAHSFRLGTAAPTIPSTVQNISSSNITDTDATISWDAIPTAATYRVYIRTTNSFPGTCEPNCWVTSAPSSGDRVSVKLSDYVTPVAGQNYYVKVSATGHNGKLLTGWQSSAHGFQLDRPTVTIPDVVQNISASNISDSDANISWDTVPTAATYRIYIRTINDFPGRCEPHCWVVTNPIEADGKTSVNLSSYLDGQPGATYWVKVSASGADGKLLTGWQSSAYSFTLTQESTPTIPDTVQNIRATDVTATDALLSWDAVPTAATYRVYIRPNSTFPYHCEPDCWEVSPPITNDTASVPLSTFLEPSSGTTYHVKISASDANGRLLTGWQSTAYSFRMGGQAVVDNIETLNTTALDTRVRWTAFPGAARYRVYWSTSPTMPSSCEPDCALIKVANSLDPNVSLASLTRITPGATYYLKVSAVDSDNRLLTTWQDDPVSVKIGNGNKTAVPTNVRFTSTSPTSITVAWDSNIAAPAHIVELRGATSRTIRTVEREATFAGLTPGAQYTVAVRTAETDGATLSAKTATRAVTTPTSGDRTLRTGSYNVRCANCTTPEANRPFEELPWAERRLAVADVIVSRNPAVIGIQEVSQGWLYNENGSLIDRSQFEDLERATTELGHGYKVTNVHRNNCVNSKTPTNCRYQDRGASQGTRIFYDPAQVTLLDQGSRELPRATSTSNQRYLAWAEFSRNDNGERFFFANTHLEPGSSGVYPAARALQSIALVQELETLNDDDLPAILAGDMNSTRYFNPNSPMEALTANGWLEPLGHRPGNPNIGSNAIVESRVRANYNSYNGFVRDQRRYGVNQNGSNLDYLFVTPMRVTRWETAVRLDANGDLTEIIPSDHNALYADVILP